MNINVPKSMLPDCKIGETLEMKIEGEDGDSFILSPYEAEPKEEAEPTPPKKAAKSKATKRPKAVAAALMEEGE